MKFEITEKVSPMHPDKIADRIAGALVDYCYSQEENPKCAFEVLIGHGGCFITGETSVKVPVDFVKKTAERISRIKLEKFEYIEVPQDHHLARNQKQLHCGDNGVFAGFPMPDVHKKALDVCKSIYRDYPFDGKIVINEDEKTMTICWSNALNEQIGFVAHFKGYKPTINPLGYWTGGVNVDTGVTGRKLASDFYGIECPLGGGTMHGKDLSKADCSVNIYCFLRAQETRQPQKAICSIGDEFVNVNGRPIPFAEIVGTAKCYITQIGGFEKLAEWGFECEL